MKYEEARRLMKTARNPAKGKPIGNNTRLFEVITRPADPMNPSAGYESYYSVRLHGNEILRIHEDRFVPNAAGWYTVTTKARLNEHMEVGRVFQRNWDWYFTTGDTNYEWRDMFFVSTRDENYGEDIL